MEETRRALLSRGLPAHHAKSPLDALGRTTPTRCRFFLIGENIGVTAASA